MLSGPFTFSIAVLVALWLLLPLLCAKNRYWRSMVLIPLIPVQLLYLRWRYTGTLDPFKVDAAVLWQYIFFGTEVLVVLYTVWQCVSLVRYRDRSRECDELIEQTVPPLKAVDLFIPTHSESATILSRTIDAAKRDRYDQLTVWVCDDSDRQWLKSLCAEKSVNYLNRPTDQALRTKAANLRWSIPHGKAEYIVCVDADFCLEPEFTNRLTAFFANPEIGLVQAPQHFCNLDPVQRNLYGGNAWAEEQRFFFDVSLPSRDAWGNTLCVGSCWATRRDLIDQMGGFPIESVVEDVYFGYRVKSLGYQTIYLNEKLAVGLAAEDTPSYIVQRTRWCMGAMALLSDRNGPFRANGLTLVDRIFYFEIAFYWLTHVHLLLLLLAPAMYGLLGYNVFNCSTEELFSILVPKNILVCAVFYWVSNGRCMPLVTPVQKTLTVFHVVPGVFRGMLFPRSVGFSVTRKDINHHKRTFHWGIAAPFIAVGIITMLAVVSTFSQNYSVFYWSDYSAYNALLSTYSIVCVFLCCLVCVDKPESERTPGSSIRITGNWRNTLFVLSRRIFT